MKLKIVDWAYWILSFLPLIVTRILSPALISGFKNIYMLLIIEASMVGILASYSYYSYRKIRRAK